MLKSGQEGKIVSIKAGYGLTRRLAELGFNLNTKVKVINNINGHFIVRLRDTRIAISRGIAMKILVKEN
ncbi:MAG TPA: ferrous iron transport protein A [Methanosarcinales archaeon]|nr:ferrous iron transport protein A [Methanosarcinales archaeon]